MRSNGDGIPVVALDLDGTLGNYHKHFLWFAELWLGKAMPDPWEFNPGMPLWKFMGVSRARYRECKLAYRQGGLKRFMPVYDGASDLTYAIKREKAEVWICTTRPYLRLDNIDPDTREWLRRNNIRYDAVLFGDDKYAELKRQAGSSRTGRVVVVFDDLPEQTAKAINLGFCTYIRDQPYNRHDHINGVKFPEPTGRVHGCWDMIDVVRRRIKEWREAREQQGRS